VFQTARWLQPLNPEIHVVRDSSGEIKAGLASVSSRKFGISGRHTPPYTIVYGPLVADSGRARVFSARSEERRWLEQLLDQLPSSGHDDFLLAGSGQDLPPFHWRGFECSQRLTYIVRGSYEAWLSSIANSNRRTLRKLEAATAAGDLQISHGGQLRQVLDLAAKTAERNNYDFSARQLEALLQPATEGRAWSVISVLKEGEVLAGSVLVHDSARAWHIVNGIQRGRTGLDARANLLCLSSCIRVTLEAGRIFDFEGSLLPGVEEYYRTMGGTPEPVLRLQRSRNPAYRMLRAGHLLLREQQGLRLSSG
jgi:hypothetical protein